MKVLIVLAHPEPASFNHALAGAMAAALRDAGHEVAVSDLYADGFDPVAGRHDFTTTADPARFHYQSEQALAAREGGFCPQLAREQARLAAADLVILQYPLWWGGVPAIMKGWFDRAMAYGFAYVDGARFGTGLFKGRRAMVSVTTGGPPQRFTDEGGYGDIEKALWQVQHLMLGYMGYDVASPMVSWAAPRVDDAGRAGYLAAAAARAVELAATPVVRQGPAGSPLDMVPENAWKAAR